MSGTKQQLLLIEPKNELYFEGPFNNVVLSTIKLTNPLGSPVCFKVKTTVPKRYCVRPSSGVLEPNEERGVAVMLQPFNYDPTEKTKHKFMIQSMVLPEGVENLENVWKEADPSKIMDSKLICILRLPGELVVQPSHELVFEGPFTQAVCSNITLKNPSTVNICFKLHASSTRLSASPTTGVIEPNEKATVIGNITLDEKIKPKHGHSLASVGLGITSSHPSQAPDVPTIATKNVDALLAEIAVLRRENAVLKETDIRLRRSALSGTCLTSAEGGGAAIGRTGVIGAIASVPPILYLILALLIGLVLGKLM
ncbi:Vesicle-associated membrane protein-associated protein A [Fasciola hepatica]|uniref:Vesicle-associated membrane protein-associated protein A n=1 Tax=Fasciola hepatica TaxID=6192 RepID=A0A4E0RQ03_FASHE|nr:Vesicle-associated membrane protein-associated protein A [Fasciola hepatica]